ncbi:hypothetical protein DFR52_105299 [Hoeflea marina]|uniref:Uncharacterized protein n=1 Tax=Hoeflea marina TaxID=274592 RepID=A0A317PG34_9HYPH|nr:hypothetical protein [Hoeflea marina]PWV98316.1 hypothetical protein DFR52_105299 [Hoeflea marina]
MRPIPMCRTLMAALAAGSLMIAAPGAVADELPVSGVVKHQGWHSSWRDDGHSGNRHHRWDRRHKGRYGHRGFKGQPLYGNGPLPDRVPGLGTFSGDLDAERDRGNGIYFSLSGRDAEPGIIPAPAAGKGPKIIRVKPKGQGTHCHDAGSVCVIRP